MHLDGRGRVTHSSGVCAGVVRVSAGQNGRRAWLAVAVGTAGIAAFLCGCSSNPAATTEGPGQGQAQLLVENQDPLPVTVTIDLQPPVELHPAIQTCQSLSVQVPVNDTINVLIADSTATGSAFLAVQLYEGSESEIIIPAEGPPSVVPLGSKPGC
jgi:hypothetical protein